MTRLPASLPRATDLTEFYANPLAFLAQARAALGDIFVLREEGPLFSRSPDCAGVIAVFGSANTEAVLTDTDAFGLPISAAEHLLLPQNLINLNRGLHSLRGQEHDEHRRLLVHVFNNRSVEFPHERIRAGLEKFVRSWAYNDRFCILEEMRRLALDLSGLLLFDRRYSDGESITALAQKYFHMRRSVTSPFDLPNKTTRTELIALGGSLDQAMRKYVKWCRNEVADPEGYLAEIGCLQVDGEYAFSEDEAVAHGNVTFMSLNEPIAAALTWTLIILSQIPELQRTLRDELERSQPIGDLIKASASLPLLNSVVNESLRLFTPNAMMSRITTRETVFRRIPLPAQCELVLCPFVAHRDPKVFPQPTRFSPSRWQSTKASPFEYFPFGAGGHACIGRSLGIRIIKAANAFLVRRYQFLLAFDQDIDWCIDIIFTPANDPIMTLLEPRTTHGRGGILRGPIAELFQS
jgi:cytochrome P450